jgi:chromosome segregation ATPase
MITMTRVLFWSVDPNSIDRANRLSLQNVSSYETPINTDASTGKNKFASLQAEIETLMRDKRQQERDLQTFKRQQIQYQQQIAESDALLRDLRSREADSAEAMTAKDSQIALLRVRLAESDDLLKNKTAQCDQLQGQCARILQDHNDSSGIQSQAFDSMQQRLTQLEHDLQHRTTENDRLLDEHRQSEKRFNDERQQLIEQIRTAEKRLTDERLQMHEQQQQVKHAKNLNHQLDQDMNEYKAKAQRILQTKDKLIQKLKEIAHNRSASSSDIQGKCVMMLLVLYDHIFVRSRTDQSW